MKKWLSAACLLLLLSCDPFWGAVPGDDPLAVYDSFWRVMDKDYAGYTTKTGTDWAEVRSSGRAELAADPTEDHLKLVLQDIFILLNDGHMDLDTGDGRITVMPEYADIPFDFLVIRDHYLTEPRWDSSGYIFSGFAGSETGYLWIPTFSGSGWIGNLPGELDRFNGYEFLIIDLRNNGGGQSTNGEALLEHFIGEQRIWGRALFHMGPDNPPAETVYRLDPVPGAPRPQTVVLLFNEGSCSTTDMVICGFQAFTGAYSVGRPTRAELVGNNYPRELPNGWILRMGTVNNLMLGDAVVDGDMIPVDLGADNSFARLDEGLDDQLEAALSWIDAQIHP
jgi:hypothetical protein